MAKRLIFSIVLFVMAHLATYAASNMGPFPMPYSGKAYIPNPTVRMNAQQRWHVQEAFKFIQHIFSINHNQCIARGMCLHVDLGALQQFIAHHPRHPANPVFQEIHDVIRRDAQHQVFGTQWIIFNNLSPARQQEYRNGLRIAPLQPQMVQVRSGDGWITVPAHYSQDDVLTVLLGEIDHRHRSCHDYIGCISGDQQIIKNFYNRLDVDDPVRGTLDRLSQMIKNTSDHYPFNSTFYLNLYNPFGPQWNDMITRHHAKNLTAYGHKEWKQVQQNTRAQNWYAARPTNGQIATQSQPQQRQGFQSYLKQERSRLHQEGNRVRQDLRQQAQPLREWWNDSRDFFKKWYKGE